MWSASLSDFPGSQLRRWDTLSEAEEPGRTGTLGVVGLLELPSLLEGLLASLLSGLPSRPVRIGDILAPSPPMKGGGTRGAASRPSSGMYAGSRRGDGLCRTCFDGDW